MNEEGRCGVRGGNVEKREKKKKEGEGYEEEVAKKKRYL